VALSGLGRRRCGDPREPGNVVKPELVAPGQRMVGGQHEHARLLADCSRLRPGAAIGGRTKAISVLRSSRPAAGWVSSKVERLAGHGAAVV
jgi:hypothetical protein